MTRLYPTLICEIAFATAPMATPTWTDVSARLRGHIALKYGRQNELGRIEAGTLRLGLDNRDGALTKANTSSPYYPNVKIRRRIRLRAAWGGATNGQQTINLGGATSGVWALVVGSDMTATLAWNASAATVQAAIELSLVGRGNATVSGAAGGPYTVTFVGARADTPPILTLVAALYGGGATSITLAASPDTTYDLFTGFIESIPSEEPAGSFRDARVALSAIDGLALLARSKVNGSLGAAVPTTTTTIVGSGSANEVQVLSLNGATAGTFRLVFGGQKTSSLAYNASAATVQAALRPLSSIGATGITVTGAAGGPYTMTFGGPLGLSDQPPIVANLDIVGQRSDLMVAAMLDAVGWPAADRLLDTGVSTLADAVISGQTSAFQLLTKIADSENGVLFVNASGQVVFQNRYRRGQTGTAVATFSDTPTGAQLPYSDLLPSDDDTQFYNEVIVTAAGGIAQVARDTASIAEYWISTLQRTDTLIATDTEANSAALFLLAQKNPPATRVPAIVLRGILDPSRLWPQLLTRQIGDRIRTIKHPRGGGLIDQDAYIEQVQATLKRDERSGAIDVVWQWQLSPATVAGYWVLGDATWGVLGVTTRLAY
jgi:hypothetical protein